MMYGQQIGDKSAQQSSIVLDTSTAVAERPLGLLGNLWTQRSTMTVSVWEVSDWPTLTDWFHAARKLEILKQQHFTSNERQRRIQNSLAALDATQPTNLKLEEWKAIVEEVEEDED